MPQAEDVWKNTESRSAPQCGACLFIVTRILSLEPSQDNERVIDRDGFRPNVGIVICNAVDQVLWGRRINGRDSWQFPQGGMHRDETPEQAMYRELEEEVGLAPSRCRYSAELKVGCITVSRSGSFDSQKIRCALARSRSGFCFD